MAIEIFETIEKVSFCLHELVLVPGIFFSLNWQRFYVARYRDMQKGLHGQLNHYHNRIALFHPSQCGFDRKV